MGEYVLSETTKESVKAICESVDMIKAERSEISCTALIGVLLLGVVRMMEIYCVSQHRRTGDTDELRERIGQTEATRGIADGYMQNMQKVHPDEFETLCQILDAQGWAKRTTGES